MKRATIAIGIGANVSDEGMSVLKLLSLEVEVEAAKDPPKAPW